MPSQRGNDRSGETRGTRGGVRNQFGPAACKTSALISVLSFGLQIPPSYSQPQPPCFLSLHVVLGSPATSPMSNLGPQQGSDAMPPDGSTYMVQASPWSVLSSRVPICPLMGRGPGRVLPPSSPDPVSRPWTPQRSSPGKADPTLGAVSAPLFSP